MNRDLSDLDFDPLHFAFGENPLEWRHHDPEQGVVWRILRYEDLPELRRLWAEMDAKLGKQDKPDQFRMPVVLTLVAEDDQTGEMLSAIYGEAVVDFTMIGTSRRVARSVKTVIPYIELNLFPRSIRIVRVLVPVRLARHVGRLLPRFTNITQSFAQFVYKIRA